MIADGLKKLAGKRGNVLEKTFGKKDLNFCFFQEKTIVTSFVVFQEHMNTHMTNCGEYNTVVHVKKKQFKNF